VYDKRNRWTIVDFPGDTLANSFAYNALDQRMKKVDSDGVVNFIYDGAGVLMETNQSGQILGAYTNGLTGTISKRNASQARAKGKRGGMSTVIVSSHGSGACAEGIRREYSEGTEPRSARSLLRGRMIQEKLYRIE